MIVKSQVSVVAVRPSLEATAEETAEDLTARQTEPAAVQQSGEKVFDVLAVDLLPGDNVGAEPFLADGIEALPKVRYACA